MFIVIIFVRYSKIFYEGVICYNCKFLVDIVLVIWLDLLFDLFYLNFANCYILYCKYVLYVKLNYFIYIISFKISYFV